MIPRFVVSAGLLAIALGACRPAANGGLRDDGPVAADVGAELAALGSDSWTLVAWSPEESAPPSPTVTLRYAHGSFSGRSGCNRYTGPVEQRPGRTIAVGAITVTRMMCPPPIRAVERRFLAALGRARAIAIAAGRLAILTTDDDGRALGLRFVREASPGE